MIAWAMIVKKSGTSIMTAISSKEQCYLAVARVEELLPLVTDDTPTTDPASMELELLSNLVADYSEVNFAIGEPGLTGIMKLRMAEMGITKKTMANLIGVSLSPISDFLGRAEPTLSTARRISNSLKIDLAIMLDV